MIRKGISDVVRLSLTDTQVQRLDTSDWGVDWLIVTVMSGVLDLFVGENPFLGSPNYRFRAGDPTIPIPIEVYGERFVLTAQGRGGVDQTNATVTLVARAKETYNGG